MSTDSSLPSNDYFNSYTKIFDVISNAEVYSEDFQILNEIFGFDGIEQINSDEFNNIYVPGEERLGTFYKTWENNVSVENFYDFLIYYKESDTYPINEAFIDINNVINYLLTFFFENNIVRISDLGNKFLRIKPTFVPESDTTNYTPLLKNFLKILNPTIPIGGPIGEESLNFRCLQTFKNYLVKNNSIVEGKNVNDLNVNPGERNMWNTLYDSGNEEIVIDLDKSVRDFRKYMDNNFVLDDWCGCYAPPSRLMLKRFGDTELNGIVESTTCDQLCTNAGSVKRYANYSSENAGNPVQCNATVCIMSDLNVKLADSDATINFAQVCPGCASDPTKNCICVLDVDDNSFFQKVTSGGKNLSYPPTFQQVCPNSICYNINEDGSVDEYECSENYEIFTEDIRNFRDTGMTLKEFYERPRALLFIFIALLVFYIVILLIFLLYELGERMIRKYKSLPEKVKFRVI